MAWQGMGGAGAGAGAGATPPGANPFAAAGGAAGSGSENPAFQPAMWWNALQQQFAQIGERRGPMRCPNPRAAC